jgi:hypothetical protein
VLRIVASNPAANAITGTDPGESFAIGSAIRSTVPRVSNLLVRGQGF